MKKFLSLLLACMLMMSVFSFAGAETKDGTYTQTVKGFNDGLKVETVIKDGKIESVTVLESNETDPGQPAIQKLPGMIVEHQSVAVDTISGATRTSEGIIKAVTLALEEAGADLEAFSTPAHKEAEADFYPTMGSYEVPSTWDETFDIIVVGGGFAGMAATYASVQNGAKTVLVEKLSTTGGNSAINGGQYAAWTSSRAAELQKKAGVEPDTYENHVNDTLKGGDNMGVPALVKTFVAAGAKYFDLLLENGLEIRDTIARPGGHYSYRTYITKNQVGSDITSLQLKMLQGINADVRLENKMVEIYRTRDDANRVVGIRVSTPDGFKNLQATKGVILATGGFSSNVAMRQTQVPYLTEDIPTTNIVAASTGEGIYLAQAIGANTTQMSNIQRYPFANPENGVLDKYAVWPFTGPSYGVVYVDYQGKRYVNEGERRDVCANAAAKSGFISTYALFTEPVVSGFLKEGEIEAGIAAGRVLKGETLAELAEAINGLAIKGMNPQVTAENLENTVNAHNGFIDSGKDEEFNKVMSSTMVKMEKGPYYAVPQFPSVHHTMGGLVIDETTQVYDIFGKPIPGLYAAGEVTGGIHGTNRLGSNADTDACGFGYVSGIFVSTGEMPDFVTNPQK